MDSRFFMSDDIDAGAESLYLRRVRLALEGTMFGLFDFKIMPNFGLGRAELQDAYLDARFSPGLNLRAGKFKTPAGLEFLQSPTTMYFIERAYPTGLVPNRDVGVAVHGRLIDERLTYAIGIFNGSPDGGSIDADLDNGKDVIGRVFAHPLGARRSAGRGLGLGIAMTAGTREGTRSSPNLASYRTSGRQTFFHYESGESGTFSDGHHVRLIPQAYFYHGPAGFLAEYALSRQDVAAGDAAATLTHRAWQVAGGYVLTGENATFGRLTPKHPYGSRQGSWGAVEFVARIHGFSIDAATFPVYAKAEAAASSAITWGIGFNWHLNSSVRLMVNYEHTQFDAADGAAVRDAEHLLLSRFQIAF